MLNSNMSLAAIRYQEQLQYRNYYQTYNSLKYFSSTYVITTIAILGILANLTAFVVLCYQKQRLTTTVLLQCLAIIDSLVLLVTVLKCVAIISSKNRSQISTMDYYEFYKRYMTWLILPVSYFLRLSGNWLTIQLTYDRWIAVCKPLDAQRICTLARAYRNMVLIFIISAIFTIPRCLEFYGEIKMRPIRGQPGNFTPVFYHVQTDMAKSVYYLVFYRILSYSLAMYLVPMVALVVLNVGLVRRLKQANEYRTQLMRQASHQSESSGMSSINRSVTIIVLSVVAVCVITNTVAAVTHVFKSWTEIESIRENKVTKETFDIEAFHFGLFLSLSFKFSSIISNIMVSLNSAINFFIYCLCSRNFRSKLCEICGRAKEKPMSFAVRKLLYPRINDDTSTNPENLTNNSTNKTVLKKAYRYSGRRLNRTKSYSSNGSGHVVDNTTITLYPMNTNSLSKPLSKEEQKLLSTAFAKTSTDRA